MATKRQQQARETKERIAVTANRLFDERGYDEVTISDIAKICGIGAGTMYHYFKSKEDLFLYLQREHFADRLALSESSDEGTPIVERACAYVAIWCDTASEDSLNYAKTWYRLAVSGNLNDERTGSHFDDDYRNMVELLQKGIATGELKPDTPVPSLASSIICAINGAALIRCIDAASFDFKTWSKEYVETIVPLHLTPYLIP